MLVAQQLFACPQHVLCRTTLLYKVVWLNCGPCGRTLMDEEFETCPHARLQILRSEISQDLSFTHFTHCKIGSFGHGVWALLWTALGPGAGKAAAASGVRRGSAHVVRLTPYVRGWARPRKYYSDLWGAFYSFRQRFYNKKNKWNSKFDISKGTTTAIKK